MPPKKSVSVEKKDPNFWAIKKVDGEPLLRADVQYQLLQDIFNDRNFRFTAPVDQAAPPGEPVYLNFDQLYLEAILSSLKTTLQLRTKLIENPEFSIAFCKLCLLINVGRINTTLAFYPSMKTALRTYHSIPSLQHDELAQKDMSDAPRVKAILKACFLDWEVTDQPGNLRAVAMKAAAANKFRGPPTTVVTAIFLLFNEASVSMPSAQRATTFLTLVHRVLENPAFLADFDVPLGPPILVIPPIHLSRAPIPGAEPENIDTPQEIAYGQEMKELRAAIYKKEPVYQKKEEMLGLRESRKVELLQKDAFIVEPTQKKRRVETKLTHKSYSKTKREAEMNGYLPEILTDDWETTDWSSDNPTKLSLPATWQIIERDMAEDRDPDYESEEEALPLELLQRRLLLTFRNPTTNLRGPVKDVMEHEEWIRRKDAVLEEEVKGDQSWDHIAPEDREGADGFKGTSEVDGDE